MSSSYSCEQNLRDLASELYSKASELEKAADVLKDLRGTDEVNNLNERIQSAKKWAKDWMKP